MCIVKGRYRKRICLASLFSDKFFRQSIGGMFYLAREFIVATWKKCFHTSII